MKSNKKGMIHEDRSKPSNLPQDYINSSYPEVQYINAPVMDDMYAIDDQINNAVSGTRKQLPSKKY